MSKSKSADAKLDRNVRSKQETRAQVEEHASFPIKEGLSDSNANLENWNTFITEEINSFLSEFQGIEIVVTPEGAGEMVFVLVHPPYMLQSVTIVDSGEEFDKLQQRHQNRLKNAASSQIMCLNACSMRQRARSRLLCRQEESRV